MNEINKRLIRVLKRRRASAQQMGDSGRVSRITREIKAVEAKLVTA